jgi:hypothetical protein
MAILLLLLLLQGDSGFVVVRGGQVVLRSSPKQHFFDCPLQFGAYPEHVDDTDTADDAEIYQLPVLPGDVIIAGMGCWVCKAFWRERGRALAGLHVVHGNVCSSCF